VLMFVLRFTHIVFGALWVGMMAFQTFFLMPALAEAGPDAGKLMGPLMRRRIPLIMMVLAILTLLSGFVLFDRLAGGNHGALMRTPMGKGYAWGATAALLAFLLGMLVTRPAMMRSMRLAESLGTAPPEERATRMAEMQRLRARGAAAGRVVAVLLLIALTLMAVARYL
jgi:uncharacterized membrane protein